jgi:SAM-dependent methyltransferase
LARSVPVLRHLPPGVAAGSRVLAVGADAELLAALPDRGVRVDAHGLDLGPAAAPAGEAFSPPATRWPVPDGAYDAVLLLDRLALVVDDEATVAEAARVLRPGGSLLVRVPRAGRLAWLDPYNAARYLGDATRRGAKPPETRGIGWRRHYARRDVDDLLRGRFRVRAVGTEEIGLAEGVRLALALLFRWLLPREEVYRRATGLPAAIGRIEGRVPTGRAGYHLIVVAERLPASAAEG